MADALHVENDDDGFGPVDTDAELARAGLAEKNQFLPPPNPAAEKPAERQYDQQDYLAAKDRMERDGLAVASGADATEKYLHYTSDQHLFHVKQKDRQARRSQNVVPSAMTWVNAKMVAFDRLYIQENYAAHEAILTVFLSLVVSLARNVPRFVLAHLPLYVRPRTFRRRKAMCAGCTFRRTRHGMSWCDAVKDAKLCACPQSPSWPLGGLAYMTALASFSCPIGKFNGGRIWVRGVAVAILVSWVLWRYVL